VLLSPRCALAAVFRQLPAVLAGTGASSPRRHKAARRSSSTRGKNCSGPSNLQLKGQCTTSRESTRTVGFPPRELRALQLRVRTEQQTPEWKTRYAVRLGIEGTVDEFAHGYGMRRCRYRGQGKAHIQHVLTAIAVNIERLSGLPPTEEASTPRRPTALQNYLDQREIPRPKSWRTLGS
jgi:hypothetical protein